ncbi:hypothetical protein ACHHYP_07724 [Achlya hypogyna]|uniref:Uncharacterized protein n=1 Tax=Achlya hypogyna TaxID=1202772 RepID=A0A1V9YR04_ACHHY|nr:hypothetical protein ACHHYP_07724 [Achlya hypogyna]
MHDVDMTGDDEYEVPRVTSLKRASPMEAAVEHQLKRLKIQRPVSPDVPSHWQQEPQRHRHLEQSFDQQQYQEQKRHQYEPQHHQQVTGMLDRYDPVADANYATANRLLRELHFLREMRKHTSL